VAFETGSTLPFLALGCVGMIAAGPAYAAPDPASVAISSDPASVPAAGDPADQPAITVTGTRLPERTDPRATQPLRDTPQTVTVVSEQTLRRQNLLTLRDALTTIPGITFGAGEGGGGYGDAINLRGYSGSNDITVDGVRDSAQYSRTDPFNLQQIEVYNGANSVFNGSGSIGGTINLVSKAPQAEDLTILSAAIGTDNYWRGTVDANRRIGENIAVRLNAMIHRNDVPGRDFEHNRRWGIAPSITFGIGGPTSLTLAYVHQDDNNIPVYGVPFFRNQLNDGPLPEADDSDYFGFRNLDRQDILVDRLTATFHHDLSRGVRIRNLTRWQRVDQYSQTTAPQGTFCLTGTGRQPVAANATATVGLACPANLLPGQFQRSSGGPVGLVRDQENQLLHNQTDLSWEVGEEGALRNVLVVGGSLTFEDYRIETAGLTRDATGALVTQPIDTISNPGGLYTGPINYTVTARNHSETQNQALYAFDTLELNSVVGLNGAVRIEHNRARFQAEPLLSYPPGTVPLTALQLAPQESDETLFSYRAGLVVKPARNLSFYAAYGNSRTPSSATVRLGCGVVTAPGGADPCATAPETGVIYELGAKADLLHGRLQLTASIFRNERSNYRVPSNDPAAPAALQVLDGHARVDGITLGISGNITPRWSIFANYTYLDGRVVQSVSDFCLANPSAACANSAAIPDPQAGDRLIQAPDHAGSLFTTYRLPFGLEVGYGFTYQGSFALNQRNILNRTQYFSDAFLIHRFFMSYTIGHGLTAQLNIQNATDEDYYVAIRNNVNATTGAITGGWATPGEARSAVLSLFYSF
jgi:catecholate siderophore receptor